MHLVTFPELMHSCGMSKKKVMGCNIRLGSRITGFTLTIHPFRATSNCFVARIIARNSYDVRLVYGSPHLNSVSEFFKTHS